MASADERDRHESNQIDHASQWSQNRSQPRPAIWQASMRKCSPSEEAGNAQRRYEAAAENSRRDQLRWESAQLEVQEYGLEAAAGQARREALAAIASDRRSRFRGRTTNIRARERSVPSSGSGKFHPNGRWRWPPALDRGLTRLAFARAPP